MTKGSKFAEKIASINRTMGFAHNFDTLLDFALFMFLANPTEEECKAFNENRQNETMLEAVQMLGELSEGYHDSLGDMFMECISHGENSQFFTPEHICDFMAKINDNAGESICDPNCGSGRLLLKSLQSSREQHNIEPTLYGCDLDHRCVRMTLLNICLNSGRGDIEWGNTLTLEIFKTYHIDRVLIGGKWMSYVWQYTKETDLEALNKTREKVARELLNGGILYERKFNKPEEHHAVPEEVPAAEKPLPPIKEPERKAPIQLQLQFEY
jgi:hypothetical protein